MRRWLISSAMGSPASDALPNEQKSAIKICADSRQRAAKLRRMKYAYWMPRTAREVMVHVGAVELDGATSRKYACALGPLGILDTSSSTIVL